MRSCVAKLLNSCGFAHRGLILLQKLLSLFATWLEPISKYRNVSCNNLNELTINFPVSFAFVLFWIFALFESSFGFAIFAWKINNFVDFVFAVWSVAIWSLKSTLFRFVFWSFWSHFWVPFFSVASNSELICLSYFFLEYK